MCQYTHIHDEVRTNEYFVMKTGPLCPNPKKGRPIHPRFKKTGLSGSSAVTALRAEKNCKAGGSL